MSTGSEKTEAPLCSSPKKKTEPAQIEADDDFWVRLGLANPNLPSDEEDDGDDDDNDGDDEDNSGKGDEGKGVNYHDLFLVPSTKETGETVMSTVHEYGSEKTEAPMQHENPMGFHGVLRDYTLCSSPKKKTEKGRACSREKTDLRPVAVVDAAESRSVYTKDKGRKVRVPYPPLQRSFKRLAIYSARPAHLRRQRSFYIYVVYTFWGYDDNPLRPPLSGTATNPHAERQHPPPCLTSFVPS